MDPSENLFLSLIINTGLVQVFYSHFWAPQTPGEVWGAIGFQGAKIEIFGPAHMPTGIKGAADQMLP